MNKIINILKPTGMTSHDVVSCVRRTLNMKKNHLILSKKIIDIKKANQ